jgi:hypothetical protein
MLLIFFVNLIVLCFAIAIFEVWVEKDQGWAQGMSPFWKKPYFGGTIIAKIGDKDFFTRYHVIAFVIVVPAFLIGEHYWFRFPWLIVVATWIGITVIEDFLWFLINPYFPAWTELLKGPHGKIWWHRSWTKFGSIYLPRYYFPSLGLMVVLLITQYIHPLG